MVTDTVSMNPEVLSVNDAAEDMMHRAYRYAARKLPRANDSIVAARVRAGDAVAYDYVRYAMARELAAYLGRMDAAVRAVYLYEPEYATAVDQEPTPPENAPAASLLVWVTTRTPALAALLDAVAAAAERQLQRLRGDGGAVHVDVQMVDDGQVSQREGYGALVHSIYVRPIQLWAR